MTVHAMHLTILAPKLCILMGVGSGGLDSNAYFIYKDRYDTGIENRDRYIFKAYPLSSRFNLLPMLIILQLLTKIQISILFENYQLISVLFRFTEHLG